MPAAANATASAVSVLSLLDESDDALKLYALEQLDKSVDDFWFQISGSLAVIEALYEDEGFAHRELAALVASKVFYHLDDLDDAMTYALGAGSLFNVHDSSDYVQSILSRCIDSYIMLRQKDGRVIGAESPSDGPTEMVGIDARLEQIIERLFDRCLADGQLEQAVGIALESRRLDKILASVKNASDVSGLLGYILAAAERLITSRAFRDAVLRLIVEEYQQLPEPDHSSICRCLITLEDSQSISKILSDLLNGSNDEFLLAFQLGFDLFEAEVQSLRAAVRSQVAARAPKEIVEEQAEQKEDANEVSMNVDGHKLEIDIHKRFKAFDSIVSGEVPIELERQFLARCNAADLQVLKNIKAGVEPRNSVCHGATVFSNSVMHCGTTVDTFLRENLDWLAKSTNWAKFSATAGLGVIHKGNLKNSRSILSPYLPSAPGNPSSSQYSEGGALFALGLIHANQGGEVRQFLLDSLRGTQAEVVQHGACLGLGIAGLGTEDDEVFEEIDNVLYQDSAVAGEAAGMALGLLFAGTGSSKAEDMLAYAHETQHEKITRGLALGLAIISYRQEECADGMIEAMTLDQDSILRYGGMFVIGLAYCGTGRNAAIQKLLHFAVSDVSDDVRRAATMCLGFVLAGDPAQCPKIVALLAESYNPHVRYGAALAMGIAAAGTGSRDALALLEPMMKDSVDFVQQGALIATSLVLIEQPEAKQKQLRERISSLHSTRGAEIMARMGAIMAAGILDAGGRNSTLSLKSQSGHLRRSSVIGLAMFLQYWYWYPLSYCLSMALHPTALIGIDSTLRAPADFKVQCNCKPSLFAYPAPVAVEDRKTTEKLPTAVLSTTVRAKARAAKKAKEKKADEEEKMVVDGENAENQVAPASEETLGKDAEKAASNRQEEPVLYTLENPARVVAGQQRYVSFQPCERWQPVRPAPVGFIVLKDRKLGQPVEYLFIEENKNVNAKAEEGSVSSQKNQDVQNHEDNEPAPPEPFEYIPS